MKQIRAVGLAVLLVVATALPVACGSSSKTQGPAAAGEAGEAPSGGTTSTPGAGGVSGRASGSHEGGLAGVAGATEDQSGAAGESEGGAADAGPAEDHLAALRLVEAKCNALTPQNLAPLTYLHAIADYMATIPDYAGSTVDEASLTAFGIFHDGRVHLVTDDTEFTSSVTAQAHPVSADSLPVAGSALPKSGYVRLLQSFGEACETQAPITALSNTLENPGEYQIRPGNGDASLDSLRAISGDAFLYFNTHGGRASKTVDPKGTRFFSLQSSTLVTPATEVLATTVGDHKAGRLTYFTAPVCGGGIDTRYGITADFVSAYWQFDPNSIVFINACWSAFTADPSGPQDFIDACWGAGAGVYFGWTNLATPATSFPAARYLVDRLIGANQFRPETPKQRAFPWDLTFADMQKKPGLTLDASSGAALSAYPRSGGASSIILEPSIRNLIVDEYSGTLTLVGNFGDTQGKVTVAGQELSIQSWASNKIVCPLPLTGTRSNGDVIAEVPGEVGAMRKSNARQLSEWDIPLHYLWSNPDGSVGWKFEGTGTFRYRADVGGYRDTPGSAPTFPIRGLVPTKDSALSLTGSGSAQISSNCSWVLSGSGSFVAITAVPVPALVLGALMQVDTNSGASELGLAFGLAAGSSPFMVTYSGSGCPPGGPSPISPSFGLLEGPGTFASPLDDGSPAVGPLTELALTMDAQFTIAQRTYTDTRLGGTLTVEWQAAVPPLLPLNPDLPR